MKWILYLLVMPLVSGILAYIVTYVIVRYFQRQVDDEAERQYREWKSQKANV